MTTALGSWADDSGGGTPILAADLNTRDNILKTLDGNSLRTPTSPNAKDDEFDGTSSVTWADGPQAATSASLNSSSPGKLLLAGVASNTIASRLQAVPGAYPYTITTRVAGCMMDGNYRGAGIVLAPTAPTTSSTQAFLSVRAHDGNSINRWKGTFAGSFSTETTKVLGSNAMPIYLRMTVASASSVTHQWSVDGQYWVTVDSALDPGFTPALMGLGIADNSTAWGLFDFFRVT